MPRKATIAVSFDPKLEDMYRAYLKPGGSLRGRFEEIVLGDPIYARTGMLAKWNGPVTMLQTPKIAVKYALAWGIPTSKDAHRQRGEYFREFNRELDRTYSDLVKFACDTYGDHGPLVSGIVHSHFPSEIQNRLRFLSNAVNRTFEAARVHEELAKSRSPLFR
jgi:hypothetical protein